MIRSHFLSLGATAALIASPTAAEDKVNFKFSGYIADSAQVLSAEFEKAMNARLGEIEKRSEVSVLLVTVSDLAGLASEDIARDVGLLMRKLGKGEKHWIVFVLAPNEREFSGAFSTVTEGPEGTQIDNLLSEQERLEIREGLTQVFGDAVTRDFKNDRWEDGLRAGVEALENNLKLVAPAPTETTS